MTEQPGLWLFSESLLSKWGFNDGDMPDGYLDWCDEHGHPYPPNEHELLRALVRTHLVFLRARLDEDGDAAPNVHASDCASLPPEPAAEDDTHDGVGWRPQPCDCGWPARVLREVEAKRAILDHIGYELEDHGGDNPYWYVERRMPVLRLLALPYSGHPDFDERWKP